VGKVLFKLYELLPEKTLYFPHILLAVRPKLQFLGNGVVILDSAKVFVGQGPFEADVHANTESGEVKGSHSEVAIAKKNSGFVLTFPDSTIAVVHKLVDRKEVKEYAADVIVLAEKQEKLLLLLKPNLAVLSGSLYAARELAAKTGVQVVAAQVGSVIDLLTYSAVGTQKHLSKFT